MDNRSFLLINEINVLGKFRIHYGSIIDHPNYECMRATLRVIKKAENHFFFEPGYRGHDQQFFYCPLSIFYVQLNWIEALKEENEIFINAEVVVCSKDYKQTRVININHTMSHRSSSPFLDPTYLNNIINVINEYIYSDYKIELLNEIDLQKPTCVSSLEPIDLIRMINLLEFKYYSNDLSRVGKDNTFWFEVVIFNLPENPYLTRLFADIVSNSELGRATLMDEVILVTYGYYTGWCPSSGRKEVCSDIDKTEQIKDFLKLNVCNSIDLKKEQNERLVQR